MNTKINRKQKETSGGKGKWKLPHRSISKYWVDGEMFQQA